MNRLRQAVQLLLALARELSDESGYHRYLQRTGKLHSGPEWRAYIDGKQRRKFQNPKCC